MNWFRRYRRTLLVSVLITLTALATLVAVTVRDMRELPTDLQALTYADVKPQLLDRNGRALTITYQNRWNAHDAVPLHRIPAFLQGAFILAEDKRFYSHRGIDWLARWVALGQNILALEGVRGASTISEQVVRMLHPRRRSAWARWVEGWEAKQLERQFDKATILEFYLNQVPYAAQRRGVQQASRYYFDRDVETLSHKEMLALAVLVRAPSRLDLHKSTERIAGRLDILLNRAEAVGLVKDSAQVRNEILAVVTPSPMVDVRHFASHVYGKTALNAHKVQTTLNSELQAVAQSLLDERLSALAKHNVSNAGLLVVDHVTDEVLVWAVGHNAENLGAAYDSIRVPRQPGSTLKPFVYASALERGWTAATMIDDSPLLEGVGSGVHAYRNYSNRYYGPIALRYALGNSLNIPAIRAAQFVGVDTLIQKLNQLGVQDLSMRSVDYGNGIALGNAEISLYSLVGAYAALARGGVYRPLKQVRTSGQSIGTPVFSREVSSLIGDILSDADARSLEFGRGGPLNLPIQTAVKTGTSNDYRDAWVVGFNHRYVVGVWMGNLNNEPMRDITGSIGPALVLRAMFSELNRNQSTRPLFLSRELVRADICIETAFADNGECQTRKEWFIPGTEPGRQATRAAALDYVIAQPIDQTLVARDPRIPDDHEALQFVLNNEAGVQKVSWFVDDKLVASTRDTRYVWPLQPGAHRVHAAVFYDGGREPYMTPSVSLTVK